MKRRASRAEMPQPGGPTLPPGPEQPLPDQPDPTTIPPIPGPAPQG